MFTFNFNMALEESFAGYLPTFLSQQFIQICTSRCAIYLFFQVFTCRIVMNENIIFTRFKTKRKAWKISVSQPHLLSDNVFVNNADFYASNEETKTC